MQFESLNAELEHNQELANSRMTELEKLQLELQEAVRESEKLRVNMATNIFDAKTLLLPVTKMSFNSQMDLRNIPEDVVKETLEYKCLQSQFSLLYNESLGVKTQLDEARALLLTAKNAHLRQIEHMEVRFPVTFSCSSLITKVQIVGIVRLFHAQACYTF